MNDYRYWLCMNEKKLRGCFFSDPDFGFYFFTEPTSLDLSWNRFVDLTIHQQKVTVCSNSTNHFEVYRLEQNGQKVYAFALVEKWLMPTLQYLTFDDLSSSGIGLNSEELLKLFAQICILPTGNFVVGNVQDYITVVERMIRPYPNQEFFFRGHYSYKYALIPSLYRKKQYYEHENFMYMDFKTQFYNELSDKKYIEILTTMQHYKMPTRLLDTTSNPLVALYMACDKPVGDKKGTLPIGEVIVMHEERKNVKYSDSNAVTLLASLAVLETNYKQELYEKIQEAIVRNDPTIYQNCIAFKRFVAEVKSELPVFDLDFFSPDVLLKPRHVKVGMINERIIAQSGSFILFGLCDYNTGEYTKLNTVHRQRIFVVDKEKISNQLSMLNINMSTMYPDKDHTSRTITKTYD